MRRIYFFVAIGWWCLKKPFIACNVNAEMTTRKMTWIIYFYRLKIEEEEQHESTPTTMSQNRCGHRRLWLGYLSFSSHYYYRLPNITRFPFRLNYVWEIEIEIETFISFRFHHLFFSAPSYHRQLVFIAFRFAIYFAKCFRSIRFEIYSMHCESLLSFQLKMDFHWNDDPTR